MNDLLFKLCETPVLGLVLFLADQCGFSRPVEGVPLAAQADASVSVEFVAPASTEYDLELIVKHGMGRSAEATKIIGEGQQTGCDAQLVIAGAPPTPQEPFATPVEVSISSTAGARKTIHFYSPGSCGVSWWNSAAVGRRLARVALKSGRYELTVKNTSPRAFQLVTLVSVAPKNRK